MSKNEISSQVGVTSTGQKVYLQRRDSDVKNITIQIFSNPQDYFDAYAIFEALSLDEYRKNGESAWFFAYQNYGKIYFEEILQDDFEKLKQKHNLKNSIDIANYGRRLCLGGLKSLQK